MTIDALGVSVRIGPHAVLTGESLSLRPGTMTGLVGPSGSGKTTLLHCLGLLQAPTGGAVLVDGADTSRWSPARRRRYWRDRAAFVLQDSGVMDDESVAFNVVMTSGLFGRGPGGDRSRLRHALEQTGLADREDELAAHLSGGEKQRLAVARAIYKDAGVVYVDEPTASLDDTNRDLVIELFARRARAGCTVVVATHDRAVMDACDSLHRVGVGAELASHR